MKFKQLRLVMKESVNEGGVIVKAIQDAFDGSDFTVYGIQFVDNNIVRFQVSAFDSDGKEMIREVELDIPKSEDYEEVKAVVADWVQEHNSPDLFYENYKAESVVRRVEAEEVINESDEEIMKLVQNSITDGKLPDEIKYKGKTYKQFNVMGGDTTGETSDIYYCNMENTPSGDPQESDDYFFVKVALNRTDNGYEGVKEIRFVEDLTEGAKTKKNMKLITEDSYVTINDGKHEDADYLIQDVTELEDLDDEDVEAPSIEGLLSLVNESLSNKYGDTWGYMKSKSISMKENLQYAIIDIVTPSVLREAEERKIKDKAVSKTVILESVPNSKSMVNLKVNTLAGTTRFSQKTKEPAKVLTRWLESEYLYDEMVKDFQDKLAARQADLKDTTEAYLKQHPDLKIRINTIKAQEKMLKDAGMLDDNKEELARVAYAIAAEFPANVNVKGNKDNDYEMEFDTIDEIVKLLFGESYVNEMPKEEKELAKKNKKVLKDNLKESELTYDENGKAYPENFEIGDIQGLYDHNTGLVSWFYSGKGNNRLHTSANINELPDEEFPHTDKGKIKAYIKQHFLNESSLKEGYESFKIGEIEGVFNPATGEAMYSIPSKNVTDKKLNLEKIQSVETPYDTDTIIKDYIEKNYGTIDTISDKSAETTDGPEPLEEPAPTDNAEDTEAAVDIDVEEDVNTEVDTDEGPAPEETQEPQAETGTASFYKIRQRDPISIEDLNEKAASGVGAQESEYIVVKEVNLSEDEAQALFSNLSKPQSFLQGVEPIDRKNYAFNAIKVNTPSQAMLIDPVGYDYPRYVALI